MVEALVALLALPVVLVTMVVTASILAKLVAGSESATVPWGPQAASFNRIEWLAFVAMAVILAPVAEEVFHRGMFYNALRQRLHPVLAASIQAIVFGYLHPFGLPISAGIGMAAVFLVIVYEWRKTLVAPILLHAAVNAAGMTILAWNLAADAAAPRLGVQGRPNDSGCLVSNVAPGSAAEKAGVQAGDVITSVDGEEIGDFAHLTRVIRRHRVGDKISVDYLRGDEVRRADVDLTRLRE
jgi:membrane-associated protease RseP (regulator of RpoE activity)